jgi:hypothetical protein
MEENKKQEVITFKADASLAKLLKKIPNRSEFIRSALLNALESSCPLCKGLGIFTPNQRRHWQAFTQRHSLKECQDCHSLHLVCEHERAKPLAHETAQ